MNGSEAVDFVIVTALEEERDAVLALLPDYAQLPPTTEDARVYFHAVLPVTFSDGTTGTYQIIVMTLLGMGCVEAAVATSEAIHKWSPSHVLLVGIAGGFASRGIKLGDIIIADQVVDYELQKTTAEGPEVRYSVHRADPRLLGFAKNYRTTDWLQQISAPRPEPGEPRRKIGPIATGNKVDAFNEVLTRYGDDWPKLIGVEMEAGGVANACFQAKLQPGFFMVRAVSDSADEQKSSPSVEEWRQYACEAAASYTIGLLKAGPLRPRISSSLPGASLSAPPPGTVATDAIANLSAALGVSIPATTAGHPGTGSAGSFVPAPFAPEELAQALEGKLISILSDTYKVSPGAILQTTQSLDPPPLPKGHIARQPVVETLRSMLESDRVVAVTGYEECGKTISVSAFARQQDCDCFWFSTPPESDDESKGLSLLLMSLASLLATKSISVAVVTAALERRVAAAPLLIVIDDAHLFGDLQSLRFLIQISAALAARLRIILVAKDTPDFASALKTASVVEYRLPGLTVEDAGALYTGMGIDLTPLQQNATALLCSQCDGHVGLLRLAASTIRGISTESDLSRFVSEISGSLGPDADQFHAALMSRFRESLANNEFQLCRRMVIALRPFARRLARAIWAADQPGGSFQQAWNQCVARVFEAHAGERYDLPYLYQRGLRDYNEPNDVALWHRAAADELSKPVKDAFNPVDVCDCVAHWLLGGLREIAIEHASSFLGAALLGTRRQVTEFLLDQFEFWVEGVVSDSATSRATRVRWHAIRTRACRHVRRDDAANEAANRLRSVLTATEPVHDEEDLNAWAILLLHGALAGRQELAQEAFDRLPAEFGDAEPGDPGDRVFLLIAAYVKGEDSVLPLIRDILVAPDQFGVAAANLWDDAHGYGIWRAIASNIQLTLERDAAMDETITAERIPQLSEACSVAHDSGEREIALLLGGALARLQIDVVRDFEAATELAQDSVQKCDGTDCRVQAYCHHVLGDALRCTGQLAEALAEYSTALEILPESESLDRAQITILSAILATRSGNSEQGLALANSAVRLHKGRGSPPILLVQSLLEASGIAMRCRSCSKALRHLIDAHAILVDKFRDTPEWAAVAQCAQSLALLARSAGDSAILPVPGFTLGLRGMTPEIERMLPVAPTSMLGEACSAWGRPHRALAYFSDALGKIDDPEIVRRTAFLPLDTALEIDDLTRATKYAVLASAMPRLPDLSSTNVTFDRFLFDHIIGRVVSLAVRIADSADAVPRIDAALQAGAQENVAGNSASQVLLDSLDGIRKALVDNELASLEKAYQQAISEGALFVARDLSWFWCFRFHIGRQRSTAETVQWHWRLCWLTIAIGGNDDAYLESFTDQERSLWSRLRLAGGDDPLITQVRESLDNKGASPGDRLKSLVTLLGSEAHGCFGVRHYLSEVADALSNLDDPAPLAQLIPHVVAKVLNTILTPGAIEVLPDIANSIEKLDGVVGTEEGGGDSSLDEWKVAIDRLKAISDTLRLGQPTFEAFDALLSFAGNISLLSPESEANWHVWLRHLFGAARGDTATFEKVMELLRTDRVTELLNTDGVPRHLRWRLAICHTTANAHYATSTLAAAGAIIKMQSTPGFPASAAAIAKAESLRERALRAAESAAQSFDETERELRDGGEVAFEVWSCRHERGALRKLVGTILCLQMNEREAGLAWLRKSLADFESAIKAAKESDSAECLLRSASEAQIVAEYLGNQDDNKEFTRLASQSRDKVGDDPIVRSLDESRAIDPLVIAGHSPGEGASWPTDDATIQRYVDSVLQAMGLPESRRRGVEDDLRKQGYIQQTQRDFCKYLQPIQNQDHLESPETAYLFTTKYTCSCTLLGYKTHIESDHIETVIQSMQQNYCEGCASREPGSQ